MATIKAVSADLYFARVDQLRRERAAAREQVHRYQSALRSLALSVALYGDPEKVLAHCRSMASRSDALSPSYEMCARELERAMKDMHLGCVA